jgi:hypothetical protein
MSMFRYEHSLVADATPEAIYALYSDVSTWPAWDHAIAAMTIAGPFAAGTSGTLTLGNGQTFPYTIVEAVAGRGFAGETPIPDGVIRFEHTLEPLAAGSTRITHRVIVEGPAAEAIGVAICAGTPAAVAALAAQSAALPATR